MTKEENRYIVRIIATTEELSQEDLERKFTKVALMMGLDDIELEVGPSRPVGMLTPASLAAVWGYVENYVDPIEYVEPIKVAEKLGMSESTARKHMQRLAQKEFGVIKTVRKIRAKTTYCKSSTPSRKLADYLAEFPIHLGKWEPLIKTWEV